MDQTIPEPAIRASKRALIRQFFELQVGVRFSSAYLHRVFGSSFRSRVSDVNADETCSIVIATT